MKKIHTFSWYSAFTRWTLHLAKYHPFPVILCFITLSLISFHFVRHLKVNSDYAKLLPQDYPSVRNLNEVAAKAGGTSYLGIVLECDDFDAMLRLAGAVKTKIESWPEVKWVTYTREKAFLDRYGIFFLGTEDLLEIEHYLNEERLKHSPFNLGLDEDASSSQVESTDQNQPDDSSQERWKTQYRKEMPRDIYQTSEDRKILLITIRPLLEGSNLKETRTFYKRVTSVVEELNPATFHPEMKVFYGGSFRNRIEVYNTIVDDLNRGTYLSLSLIFLMIFAYFRQIKLFVLSLVPLLIGLLISFAITERIYHELNVIASFLFLVMTGIGIDYSLHLLARYITEKRKDGDPFLALERTWQSTGQAVITSALTTACAFLLMTWVHFQGFAQFGWIAFLATLIVLSANLILMPPLILVTERFFPIRVSSFGVSFSKRFRLNRIPFYRFATLLIFLSIPLAFYGLKLFHFDYDFRSVEIQPPSLQEAIKRIEKISFSAATPGAVLLTPDFKTLSEAHQELMHRKASDKDSPTIGRIISLASLQGPIYEAKKEIIERIRKLMTPLVIKKTKDPELKEFMQRLRSEEIPPPLSLEEMPKIFQDQLLTVKEPKEYILAIYPSIERKDGKKAIAFSSDIQNIQTSQGTLTPAGDTLVLADILRLVVQEGKIVFILSFIAIFLFVLFDFRSLNASFWVMLPLVSGLLLLPWFMSLFHVSLNFFNVIILASLVGLGVDSGVHVFHAFLESSSSARTVEAVQLTLAPILVCTLTTVAGYSGMLIAHHKGLYNIAILAVLGLLACFLTTFLVFPPLLEFCLAKRLTHHE